MTMSHQFTTLLPACSPLLMANTLNTLAAPIATNSAAPQLWETLKFSCAPFSGVRRWVGDAWKRSQAHFWRVLSEMFCWILSELLIRLSNLGTLKMSAGPSYVAPTEARKRVLPENFPVGMKVLLVDDDLTCLKVIERMLLYCLYDVTSCSEASKALSLLRDGNNTFDLVLTDVYMPEIDGFKLLEIVGLETDLPVVMISADTSSCLAESGIMHRACDFLTKPVRLRQLKTLWKHVLKSNFPDGKEREIQGGIKEPRSNPPHTVAAESPRMVNNVNVIAMEPQGRKRVGLHDDDDDVDEYDNTDSSAKKKARVVWSPKLHQHFVKAVNFLGINGAVPSRILELMNVPKLTRRHVASHLQKYRSSLRSSNNAGQPRTETTSPLSAGLLTITSQQPKNTPHTLPVSSQILPKLPAALCNESRMLLMNNQVPLQAPTEGGTPVNVDERVTFGQDQGMLSFVQGWSKNYPGLVESASNLRRSCASQHGNVSNMLLQNQSQSRFPEQILDAQSSSLGTSNPTTEHFLLQCSALPSNQDSIIGRSLSISNTQAGKPFLPENLNFADLSVPSSTNMCISNSDVLLNGSPNIPSRPLSNISIARNPEVLSSTSVDFPLQQSTNFQSLYRQLLNQDSVVVPYESPRNLEVLSSTSVDFPLQQSTTFQPLYQHLLNQDSVVVSYQSPTMLPAGNNFFSSTRNSSLSSNNSITELSRLLSPLDIGPSSMQQVINELINDTAVNEAMITNLAIPETAPSSLSPCANGNNVWQVQNPTEDNDAQWNGFTSGISGPNIQDSRRTSGEISNVKQARSYGFVGNSSYIPARFRVDDMESPQNDQ